jgi:hypothetical protein
MRTGAAREHQPAAVRAETRARVVAFAGLGRGPHVDLAVGQGDAGDAERMLVAMAQRHGQVRPVGGDVERRLRRLRAADDFALGARRQMALDDGARPARALPEDDPVAIPEEHRREHQHVRLDDCVHDRSRHVADDQPGFAAPALGIDDLPAIRRKARRQFVIGIRRERLRAAQLHRQRRRAPALA